MARISPPEVRVKMPAFMRPPAACSARHADWAAGEHAARAAAVAAGSVNNAASWAAASVRWFVARDTPRNSAMPRSIAIG